MHKLIEAIEKQIHKIAESEEKMLTDAGQNRLHLLFENCEALKEWEAKKEGYASAEEYAQDEHDSCLHYMAMYEKSGDYVCKQMADDEARHMAYWVGRIEDPAKVQKMMEQYDKLLAKIQ